MKFVADANVLFTLAKTDSASNAILASHKLKLIAPEYALAELRKYGNELEKAAGKNFDSIIEDLNKKVIFSAISENKVKEAKRYLPDPKDADYLAIAIENNLPIWSNDRHLKGQKLVEVFNTKELIALLGERK